LRGNGHQTMAYTRINENPKGEAGKVWLIVEMVARWRKTTSTGKSVWKWKKVLLD
jgi:hypothetical protein